MHINLENLHIWDTVTAILFVILGCGLYYRSYKDPAKKKMSRRGLVLVFIGTALLVFPYIFGE